jgi:ATP-dependent exoDNAse (exonuclease V) beta subunit
MPGVVIKMLAQTNPHPRDQHISFQESDHVYTVAGRHPTSVTTVVHKFFAKFQASSVIDKMMNSPNWPESKYFGMSKEQIQRSWEDNGREAREQGTLMHAQIETYLNSGQLPQQLSREFQQFLNFWKDFSQLNPQFKVYRTEWMIYSSDGKVAGSIDMVLEGPQRELIILDWKRSKEIRTDNRFCKGLGPLSHLDDCNFNHYSVQLNLYKYLLENYYGKLVNGMYIVIFHPLQSDYKCLTIPNLQKEVKQCLDFL